MGAVISKFGGGTPGEIQWLQMRVQHLEDEKAKEIQEKTAVQERLQELVQQQERLQQMYEKVHGDCQALRRSQLDATDEGPAQKMSQLFVEKRKRGAPLADSVARSESPTSVRRPHKKIRRTSSSKQTAAASSNSKVSAAVTPSPSKGRAKETLMGDSKKNCSRDDKRRQQLAQLPTKTLDNPSPGFSIEYKECDVLSNWNASYVTEGVESILKHFYPGRSRPTPEWKHSCMLGDWAPSLICRHCQGTSTGTAQLGAQGPQDGCLRLQRQVKKTFHFCVEHLLVCPTVSNHSTDVPKVLTTELAKEIRKQIDYLFEETSDSDSSSEVTEDETEEPEHVEDLLETKSGILKSTQLIVPEFTSLVSESTIFLMEQMMPWYVRKSDHQASKVFSKFKVGSRVLLCRHCLGFRSFSSAKNTLRCPTSGVNHILHLCKCCPPEIRAKLSQLLKVNTGKRETKKLFLDKLFGRLHQLDKNMLIAAQEGAVQRVDSLHAELLRDGEDESDMDDDEEEEEEEEEVMETESEEESSPVKRPAKVSAARPLGEGSIKLFEEENRSMVSERTTLLFEQLMPWVVRARDRENNYYLSSCDVGSRQIVCRHCLGFRRFPGVEVTLKNLSHASKHLREQCSAVPADIRKALILAERNKQPEPQRRRFVELVFERFKNLETDDIIKEQERVQGASPKKRARKEKESNQASPKNGNSDQAVDHHEDPAIGDHAMGALHGIGDIHGADMVFDPHHAAHAFEDITKDWDLPIEHDSEMHEWKERENEQGEKYGAE